MNAREAFKQGREVLGARSPECQGDSSSGVVVPFKQNHFKLLLIRHGWEGGEEETSQETMAMIQAGLSGAGQSGQGR